MVTSIHVFQNIEKKIVLVPTARNHKGELVQIDKALHIGGSFMSKEIGASVCSSIKIAEMGLVDDVKIDVIKKETGLGTHEKEGYKWKYLLLVFNAGKDEKLSAENTIKRGYSIFKRVNKKIKGFWITENQLVAHLPLGSPESALGENILNAFDGVDDIKK